MASGDEVAKGSRTGIRLMRGVRYIEENIEDRILLPDVASQAALSEFHFHRLFRSRYGIPVMDYVRRRRLAHAAEQLIGTNDSIVDIALRAGFDSQAAFTRAFRRVFYVTPGTYRARGRHVPWLSVSALSEDLLATLPELGNGSPRLELSDGFRVAGLEVTLAGDGRAQIPALWARLAGLVGSDMFHGADRFGISDASPAFADGLFRYAAAIEFEAGDPVALGLTVRAVPPGAYLVFTFRGATRRLPPVIDYLFGVWMPSSGHVLRMAPSFERYPAGSVVREECELELWLPVQGA